MLPSLLTLPPFRIPHHDPTLFSWKIEVSALGAQLDHRQRAALLEIIAAPLAYSYIGECSRKNKPEAFRALRRLRIPVDAARVWLAGLAAQGFDRALLASMDADGLLAVWKLYSGACTTLRPWTAQQLGLALLELSDDPTAVRWVIDRPRPVKVRRSFAVHDSQALLDLVDNAPGPVECAIDGERWTKGMKPLLDQWSEQPITIGGFPILRQTQPRTSKQCKRKRRQAAATAAGRAGRQDRVLVVAPGVFVVAG
jgi:hypothetical protein